MAARVSIASRRLRMSTLEGVPSQASVVCHRGFWAIARGRYVGWVAW